MKTREIIFLSIIGFITHLNLFAQAPQITGLSSASGIIGSTITITGNNFGTLGNTAVYFGGTKGTIEQLSAGSMNVKVPQGAICKTIQVTNTTSGLSGSSKLVFVPSFTPQKKKIASEDYLPKYESTTPGTAKDVAFADIDGDGVNDIVLVSQSVSKLSIIRNSTVPGLHPLAIANRTDFTTGSGPSFVAVSDIDGDGKQDIVVSNLDGNSLSVFRNTSTVGVISLAAAVTLTSGTTPGGVSIGDINLDGKPDIAVANTYSNSISVFKNTGTKGSISFSAKQDFTTDNYPSYVAIGDLDDDGLPDLAASVYGPGYLSLFRNTGNINTISFATRVNFATNAGPLCVAISDLDRDGKNDLLLASENNNYLDIFRNTSASGLFTLASRQSFTTGNSPRIVTTGDIDGNGLQDIIVSTTTSSEVNVWLNTSTVGSIALSGKVSYPTSAGSKGVAVGDLDGDNRPEIGVANETAGTLSILRATDPKHRLNAITPIYAIPGNMLTISGTGFDTAAGKFQVQFGPVVSTATGVNDSTLKVIVPNGSTQNNITLVNLLTGNSATSQERFIPVSGLGKVNLTPSDFSTRKDYTTGLAPNGILVTDLDNDGKAEMISCNYNSASISIFKNLSGSGTITFGSRVDQPVSPNPHYLAAGDFDGDGKRDLAVVHYSNARITILRNTSTSGTFNFTNTLLNTGTSPYGIVCADFDNDGKTDIVVANNGSNTISAFKNTSTPDQISFAAAISFSVGTALDIAAADFDKDGKTDLAITNNASGITLVRNLTTTGVFVFSVNTTLYTGSSAHRIALADFDLDGKTDIASTNYGEDSLVVLKNNSVSGTFTFQTRKKFKSGIYYKGIDAGDINGDGYPDITAVGSSSTMHSIFINTGNPSNISFYSKVDLPIGTNPFGSLIADLNADNFPEIISSNEGSANVSVYSLIPSGPKISGITPLSAAPGDTLSITGQGFHIQPDSNLIWFGSVKGKIISSTTSLLRVTVPDQAISSPLVYTNLSNGYQFTSFQAFTPTFPLAGAKLSGRNFIRGKSFKASAGPSYHFLSDLDLDGKADLIFPMIYVDSVGILKNTSLAGSINFGAQKNLYSGKGAIISRAADLNGDGKPDLIVSNSGTNTISLFPNNSTSGNILFGTKQDLISDADPGVTAIVDLNGDGKPEIISGSYATNSGFLFKNNSRRDSLSFSPKIYYKAGYSGRYVAHADFDGDGKPDLATTHFNGFGGPLSIMRNTSNGDTIRFASSIGYTVEGQATAVICRDLNSDNKPDIVVCNWASNSYSILRNTCSPGSISFASPSHYPISDFFGHPIEVTTGDMNADGKPDLIFTTTQKDFLQVKFNDSNGDTIRFKNAFVLISGLDPNTATICDMNGDRFPDVLTDNYTDSTITFLIGGAPVTNTIQNNQTICMGARPAIITGNMPSECTGNGKSKWISSTSGPDAGFAEASGKSDSVAYQPDYLSTDTWYRRIFTCNTQPDTSAAVKITVMNSPISDSIVGARSCSTNVNYSYNVPTQTGLVYTWIANNGTIQSGQGTSQVNVRWNGNGLLMLILTNTSGCSDTVTANITIIYNPNAPAITSVNPMSGTHGDTILITGNNFTGTKSVKFGNTSASNILVVNNQNLKAVLGFGGSGEVEVANAFGKATKPGFVYITSGLTQLQDNMGVEIFPNPANDRLTLKTREPMQVSLLTQDGRLILTVPVAANENEIHLSGITSGIYLLLLQSPNGIVTQRLVICRE